MFGKRIIKGRKIVIKPNNLPYKLVIALLIIWTRCVVYLFSYAYIHKFLLSQKIKKNQLISSDKYTLNIVKTVKRVSKRIKIKNCLTQSIVSYLLLTRAGSKVSLCIGVNKIGDSLKSHSWIELDKTPMLENMKELSVYKKIIEITP